MENCFKFCGMFSGTVEVFTGLIRDEKQVRQPSLRTCLLIMPALDGIIAFWT